MNTGPTVFSQILGGIDHREVSRAAAVFPMPRASRTLSVYDHFAAMVFAQLTYREGLRGIETCLGARPAVAYRMGFRGRVTRTNLALFPWARWKQTLASVKLNVLLDLRGDIPVFASLHEGKRHEVASLDELPVQPGSYYVMDRGHAACGIAVATWIFRGCIGCTKPARFSSPGSKPTPHTT